MPLCSFTSLFSSRYKLKKLERRFTIIELICFQQHWHDTFTCTYKMNLRSTVRKRIEIYDWSTYIFTLVSLHLVFYVRSRRKHGERKCLTSLVDNPTNVSTLIQQWSRDNKTTGRHIPCPCPVEASVKSMRTSFNERKESRVISSKNGRTTAVPAGKTPKKKLQRIISKAKQRSHRVISKLSIDLAFQFNFNAHDFVCTTVLNQSTTAPFFEGVLVAWNSCDECIFSLNLLHVGFQFVCGLGDFDAIYF